MKNMLGMDEKKIPAVRIDPSLDKYDNVVLSPEKLARANEQLKHLVSLSCRTKSTAANRGELCNTHIGLQQYKPRNKCSTFVHYFAVA